MSQSFEEMMNDLPGSPDLDKVKIFASMKAYPLPFTKPTDSDIQMMKAYKQAHSYNIMEAPNDMEIIRSKSICRRCMLFTRVCRLYGRQLNEYEAEMHRVQKMNNDTSQKKNIAN